MYKWYGDREAEIQIYHSWHATVAYLIKLMGRSKTDLSALENANRADSVIADIMSLSIYHLASEN